MHLCFPARRSGFSWCGRRRSEAQGPRLLALTVSLIVRLFPTRGTRTGEGIVQTLGALSAAPSPVLDHGFFRTLASPSEQAAALTGRLAQTDPLGGCAFVDTLTATAEASERYRRDDPASLEESEAARAEDVQLRD
jgi:hypothetical protein